MNETSPNHTPVNNITLHNNNKRTHVDNRNLLEYTLDSVLQLGSGRSLSHKTTELSLYGARNTWYYSSEQSATYEITNVNDTIQYYSGQLCPRSSGGSPCDIDLPSGKYMWTVTGGDIPQENRISWGFCGRYGKANQYMLFTINNKGDCTGSKVFDIVENVMESISEAPNFLLETTDTDLDVKLAWVSTYIPLHFVYTGLALSIIIFVLLFIVRFNFTNRSTYDVVYLNNSDDTPLPMSTVNHVNVMTSKINALRKSSNHGLII